MMMILADTSLWVDHFRSGIDLMAERLNRRKILMHPFVLGELLLSGIGRRASVLADLRDLPVAPMATTGEVETLILGAPLHGRGIGYVDTHLLASARLSTTARLWTHDQSLARVADELGLGMIP